MAHVEALHAKGSAPEKESPSMKFWNFVQARVNDPNGAFQISRRLKAQLAREARGPQPTSPAMNLPFVNLFHSGSSNRQRKRDFAKMKFAA
jgi:hypothetical protein